MGNVSEQSKGYESDKNDTMCERFNLTVSAFSLLKIWPDLKLSKSRVDI
jgi:hypothetical protein